MSKERILGIAGGSLGIAINFVILLMITIYVFKLIPVVFLLMKNGQAITKKEKVKYVVTFIALIFVLGIIIYAWGVFLIKIYNLFVA